MKELLQPFADKLHKIVKEVVGYVNEDFLSSSCGSQECGIGNFIADAFFDAVSLSSRQYIF